MPSFDYDVVIIGSGFGASVAALRAAEKGYRVGVMESGRRWRDEDIPKTERDLPKFLWFPAAELYGSQRIEYLHDVLMLWTTASYGSRSPGSTEAFTPSTTSAPAPSKHARFPQGFSLGRRSCANAMAPDSTSGAEP